MRLDGLDVNAVKHRTRGIEDDAGYAGLSASKGGQRHQHEDDGKDEPPLSRSARLFRRELSLQGRGDETRCKTSECRHSAPQRTMDRPIDHEWLSTAGEHPGFFECR